MKGARQVAERIDKRGAKKGATAIAVPCDVSKGADWKKLVQATLKAFKRLDIVVNNAGMPQRAAPMLETDEKTFDKIFAVNVKSIYWSARTALPAMRKAGGGCFVNIASTAGVRPRPNLVWYNASKGAVITMTKSMAVELAPDHIRVNALCPVAGETAMLSEFMGGDTPENRAKFKASIPLGRLSTPEDIANAALYLASDEASLITGVAFEIDGGRCI
jgi:3-oxoacyl-[acyl-carrier protein] reductase